MTDQVINRSPCRRLRARPGPATRTATARPRQLRRSSFRPKSLRRCALWPLSVALVGLYERPTGLPTSKCFVHLSTFKCICGTGLFGGDGLLSSPRRYSFSEDPEILSANSSSCPQVFHRDPHAWRHEVIVIVQARAHARSLVHRAPFQDGSRSCARRQGNLYHTQRRRRCRSLGGLHQEGSRARPFGLPLQIRLAARKRVAPRRSRPCTAELRHRDRWRAGALTHQYNVGRPAAAISHCISVQLGHTILQPVSSSVPATSVPLTTSVTLNRSSGVLPCACALPTYRVLIAWFCPAR
jgi:hypothetical protein